MEKKPVDCKPRPEGHYWSGIVIHHTGIGNRKLELVDSKTWAKLYKNIGNYLQTKDKSYVSAHYIIGRAGELRELVNPKQYIAWHAGKSSFWDPRSRKWRKWCNNFMIGIEIVGDGNKGVYSVAQYHQLADLCKRLCKKYEIDLNQIVGHEMVSPGRKVDPGKYFDWTHFFNLMSKF